MEAVIASCRQANIAARPTALEVFEAIRASPTITPRPATEGSLTSAGSAPLERDASLAPGESPQGVSAPVSGAEGPLPLGGAFSTAATFSPVPGSQHGSAERGAHSSNHVSGARALSEPAAAPERASLDGSVSAFANTDNALGFSGRLRSGDDATPATPRGEDAGSSGQGPPHHPSPFERASEEGGPLPCSGALPGGYGNHGVGPPSRRNSHAEDAVVSNNAANASSVEAPFPHDLSPYTLNPHPTRSHVERALSDTGQRDTSGINRMHLGAPDSYEGGTIGQVRRLQPRAGLPPSGASAIAA